MRRIGKPGFEPGSYFLCFMMTIVALSIKLHSDRKNTSDDTTRTVVPPPANRRDKLVYLNIQKKTGISNTILNN